MVRTVARQAHHGVPTPSQEGTRDSYHARAEAAPDLPDEGEIDTLPSLTRHQASSYGRRSSVPILRCRDSVPWKARILYEDGFADLVSNCTDRQGWWDRYVNVSDDGEVLCRFRDGTHVGFLLADHICRKARGYGLLRAEVFKDFRTYRKYFDWHRIYEYASQSWGIDIAVLQDCAPDGYVMNADQVMRWGDADGSFIDELCRRQANLVAYSGGDLTGIAHSLCMEGTPNDVVQSMLRKKPFFNGREHTWGEAYIYQMNREIAGRTETLRAQAYVRGRENGGLPGHSMVYFYDQDEMPTARLPGAVEKFLVTGPIQVQRCAGSVVRAPYDIIIEDGVLVVATTKKRLYDYLQGVPGKDAIIGMLKGGRGFDCEASVAGTIKKNEHARKTSCATSAF